jgi:hypothetical protein
MTAPGQDGWYWTYLSRQRQFGIVACIIPRYLLHLILRPYRKGLPREPLTEMSTRLRARHAAAALDVWVHQLLRAYPGASAGSVNRGLGCLAIRYMRVLAVFNREYEHRLATGQSLDLAEICAVPLVASRLSEWEEFTTRYTREPNVVRFLSTDAVADDYAAYVAVTTRPGFDSDLALQVDSIRLDSGGYLTYLGKMIDHVGGWPSDPAMLADLFQLGMAAKLVDDLADFQADHAEGRYNLLLALLSHHPAEMEAVTRLLDNAAPISIAQWRESAPATFRDFSRMFENHYQSMRSRRLQRLCDLTVLRAVRGAKPSKGNQQHVSESPAAPWRLCRFSAKISGEQVGRGHWGGLCDRPPAAVSTRGWPCRIS